ncbi:MAG: Gfo/Idh/MocA family protein [Nitrososphaerales archaeon]
MSLTVALIGAGKIGGVRAKICSDSPYVKNLIICDKIPGKARMLSDQCKNSEYSEDYRETIERKDVDAVIVSTGESDHFDPTYLAVSLGRPTLVEKPLVLNLAEADKIVDTAAKSNTPLFVGYTQRLRRRFLLVKDSVEKGYLGRISTAFGRIETNQAVARAIIERSPEITPTLDILTYQVDMMLWFLQREPVRVYAQSSGFVFGKSKDATWGIVTFDDGSIGCFGTNWINPDNYPAQVGIIDMQLVGTKGTIFLNDRHSDFLMCTSDSVPGGYLKDARMSVSHMGSTMTGDWVLNRFIGPMKYETELFLEHIVKGGQIPNSTGKDARRVLEVTLAMDMSAATGEPVDLPLKRSVAIQPNVV